MPCALCPVPGARCPVPSARCEKSSSVQVNVAAKRLHITRTPELLSSPEPRSVSPALLEALHASPGRSPKLSRDLHQGHIHRET
eukprot:7839310-Alexandrium_andersonii.AAC.1